MTIHKSCNSWKEKVRICTFLQREGCKAISSLGHIEVRLAPVLTLRIIFDLRSYIILKLTHYILRLIFYFNWLPCPFCSFNFRFTIFLCSI